MRLSPAWGGSRRQRRRRWQRRQQQGGSSTRAAPSRRAESDPWPRCPCDGLLGAHLLRRAAEEGPALALVAHDDRAQQAELRALLADRFEQPPGPQPAHRPQCALECSAPPLPRSHSRSEQLQTVGNAAGSRGGALGPAAACLQLAKRFSVTAAGCVHSTPTQAHQDTVRQDRNT